MPWPEMSSMDQRLQCVSAYLTGYHSVTELAAPLDQLLPVDIRIAGCPPAPGAIAQALLDGLDELRA